eukprot:jgi/Bigna1/90061/estExt_fgenesh1_pg.C_610064
MLSYHGTMERDRFTSLLYFVIGLQRSCRYIDPMGGSPCGGEEEHFQHLPRKTRNGIRAR